MRGENQENKNMIIDKYVFYDGNDIQCKIRIQKIANVNKQKLM